ncbi:DNA gyrase/topoisomerase IV, subunit A family protein [Candida parapsilosis]|uniref:DNA topoisomerase 2 n=1 Tax=Candida parapsilosis TaxID=5480 RepID=A0A8X7NKD6_CANPA|nr:DNA gyrase/topoisomerase IV, subunit A family protein [Candida parapsilosis]KAF6048728.1 DNA gyrase/topoisomerase IV, subunit A family protein [Candida parapsilosis]KAF6060729.1 DNA gyrase/topoisomerase IV, subunit A family protein [Candida parapsilosis]KAI5900995.1 DNA topoisomerase 2 [Candida parapsilosis]KAI5909847.1 DNA topoisomerase 2 [Candida parapsilosis]
MSGPSDESDYLSEGSSYNEDFSSGKAQKSKQKKQPLADTSLNSFSNASTTSTGKPSNASETYQKLSQLEHILKRPDTYIGSVEKTKMEMWCFDAESESMKFQEVTIVPGLYKIFDEILVNAADNKIRDPSMKNIKVRIDPENNVIQVFNDGKGIPVEMHTKEKMYIPELIFGNLLTSSNYDDDQKKVTGGRNGFGAKLCNIFSTQFEVETADLNTGKLYKQTWTDNMTKVGKPKINALKTKKEYTKITFKPDLSKFDMDSLDEDLLSVLRRRVYDLCGTVKNCNIYLNDKRLPVTSFKSYVEMYVKAIKERSPEPEGEGAPKNYTTIVHEVFNERWEVAFAVSDGSFNQVSFVNSIATTAGGTHVKYVSDQIITKLVETLSKKEKGKKKLMIKPNEVRDNMFIFINCLIENPAFTSQTKEQLTTKVSQFGGKEKFVASDNLISRVLKTGIADKIRDIANANEDKALQKVDGSRKSRIKGQVNLVDANKAGTRDGLKCTLILTEGLSALNLAVAGLTVIGRDYYGCFPLRGKLLNVREASADQIAKNAEINSLKQIIGLQHKKTYNAENIKSLRYGHIMIMTDQDQDGSHIKGLIINFLETSFPGLLDIPGFLLEFITPIVKVTVKGRGAKKIIPFYSMPEFETWRDGEGQTCRWTQKYYKGLGTSTPMEAREYFTALDRHLKRFHALQGEDSSCIDLAFSKKKADERKEWLQNFVPGNQLDPALNEIPISEFINKELILFSMSDNIRSIPSVLDGLKPGQRKVLFGCFKRNLKSEIKVAQLAAYVSENTGYHHGEVSLVQTIIGLAQNFVGSNNINILKPNGAFGSRATGGKDAAAARYIFTELNDITKAIFNPLDNPIYTYVQDDEQTVEPQWYLPVLPMILVNGAEGIGTGWSTNIPSYDPKEIVANLRRLMNNEPLEEMTPWYKGWDGVIEPMGQQKYKISGKIEQIDDNIVEITEIPVKTWTNTVKEFLLAGFGNEKTPAWIKDMEEHHTTNIRFVVKLSDAEMEKALKVGLLEKFKLISSISLGNMVAFDPYGRIKKYNDVFEILKDFYYVRLEYYEKRKNHMLEMLQRKLLMISEQARFVKMIIEKELSVANKKKKDLIELLEKHDFTKFTKDGTPVESKGSDVFIDDNDSEEEIENEGDVSALNLKKTEDRVEGEHKPDTIFSSYDYLLGMTIWSLTHERYVKLLNEKSSLQKELEILIGKSAIDLWNQDLDVFMKEYELFLAKDAEEREHLSSSGNKKKTTRKRKAAKPEAESVKKVKVEGEAQAPPKVVSKPRTTTHQAKPKSASIEAASAPSTSSTPAPKEVTVKKEPNDILTFFSPTSKSKTKSNDKSTKSTKPSQPLTSSIFDSDDDIFEVSSKSSEKSKPKSKNTVLDELDDLEILGDKPQVLESRTRSSRPARAKVTSMFSDDESDDAIADDPSEVVEIDEDDDDYNDE